MTNYDATNFRRSLGAILCTIVLSSTVLLGALAPAGAIDAISTHAVQAVA